MTSSSDSNAWPMVPTARMRTARAVHHDQIPACVCVCVCEWWWGGGHALNMQASCSITQDMYGMPHHLNLMPQS